MGSFSERADGVSGGGDSLFEGSTHGSESSVSVEVDYARKTERKGDCPTSSEVPKITCRRCRKDWDAELILVGCPNCKESI